LVENLKGIHPFRNPSVDAGIILKVILDYIGIIMWTALRQVLWTRDESSCYINAGDYWPAGQISAFQASVSSMESAGLLVRDWNILDLCELCEEMRVTVLISCEWMKRKSKINGTGDLLGGWKSIWHREVRLCNAGCCGCLHSAGIRTSKLFAGLLITKIPTQQRYSNKLLIAQLRCKLLHVLNINKRFPLLCTESIEGKWIVVLLASMCFNEV